MRSLTKTGIRILSAKYRSILKKCAIINASVFIGVIGASSAMAVDVNNWSDFQSAVNDATTSEINVNANITYGGTTNTITRPLSIIGDSDDRYLSGNNAHAGFYIGGSGDLTLENIIMKNFTSKNGGAIYIYTNGHINNISGKFESNKITQYSGGAIYNYMGTIENISADFISNQAPTYSGGAILNYADGNISKSIIAKIGKIEGDFTSNSANTTGGAINNSIDNNGKAEITKIIGTFNSNSAGTQGGAIYNTGTVNSTTGDFISNSATSDGGAIYNNRPGQITEIIGDFNNNTTTNNAGGAIYNLGQITSITGKFKDNSAGSTGQYAFGGAIYNSEGTIETITGVADESGDIIAFEGNTAGTAGGAIYNNRSGQITEIIGDFNNNKTTNLAGGAIYNLGQITSITGKFKNNSAGSTGSEIYEIGGAIYNSEGTIGTITGVADESGDIIAFESNTVGRNGGAVYNETNGTINNIIGSFKGNSAGSNGGAIYNAGTIGVVALNDNIVFDGNYVKTADGKGGAIYNNGTVGLYADTGHSITFVGGENDTTNNKYDIDSIYNPGTLNINGYVPDPANPDVYTSYLGTVEFQNVSGNGTTNIYGGSVNANADFTQNALNIANGATFEVSASNLHITNAIQNAGTLNLLTGTLSNDVTENGAAINNLGILDIDTVTFLSNKSYSDSAMTFGGVIYNNGEINNIIDTKFIRNIVGNNAIGHISSGKGGAIYNDANGTISNIEGGIFNSNSAFSKSKNEPTEEVGGGAIYNLNQIDNINANFTGNSAGYIERTEGTYDYDNRRYEISKINIYNGKGGAIYNDGNIAALTGNFSGNHATYGGAIYNKGAMNIYADNKNIKFNGNYVPENDGTDGGLGGAIYNDVGGTMGLYATSEKSITFTGTLSIGTFGAQDVDGIYNLGTLNINDSATYTGTMNFQNIAGTGTTNIYGGIVNVAKDITQKTITIGSGAQLNATGNIITETLVNNGDITVSEIVANIQNNEGASITFNNNEILIVNLTNSGTVNFNGYLNYPDSNVSITQNAGIINFSNMAATEGAPIKVFTMNGGSVNIADEDAYNILHINQLNLTGNIDFTIDADLENEISDRIKIHDIDNSEIASDKTITIKGINLLSDATQDKISLDLFADDNTKQLLANNVSGHLNGLTYSPIYKYDALYDPTRGQVDFTRYNNGGYDDLNPAVMAGAVAAQVGGYLNQINSYENAFEHMDSYMMLSRNNRLGTSLAVKYITDAPRRAWLKPYAAFETVKLKHGPKVDNNMYGSFAGLDSAIVKLKHGWDIVYSGYASYDGSNQKYDGNSIYQNGGHLGATLSLYKGNFFTGLTANAGASSVKLSTMDGADDTTMFTTGAASKTGYDLELVQDWLIVQPSVLLSYSLVNMSDYTNASGVKISSDALHAIQIAPELKLISNLPHGWQPYIAGKSVWNMLDETKFSAAWVDLPELSTKQYVQYGIGIQKNMFNGFYGYAQAMFRNGGRDGVALNAGLKMAF